MVLTKRGKMALTVGLLVALSLSVVFIISYASAGDKVLVCHIPPGNPANAHTIMISENAVPAHLNHGDILEDCPHLPIE